MKQIEAVIFDWAGTTVDYGCMAPIIAMKEAFLQQELSVTLDEIRQPMGMLKVDHIKAILEMERVRVNFSEIHGRPHEMSDVERIYQYFEKNIFAILHEHTEVIAGVLSVQDYLRTLNIKIGSTTGYTKAMLKIVADSAKQQGYAPDYIISADEVKNGRPYPYMLHKNLQELNVKDTRCVVKVGDTIVDIQEGLNAGVCSIGIINGSSMLGLSATEVNALTQPELTQRASHVRNEMFAAGAHHVLDSMRELPSLLQTLQQKGMKYAT